MGFLERILLSLYYPQFKSPLNSRFETLFVSIVKMENPLNKHIHRTNTIYPEKIARNEDKRTSIVIKGIPKSMSKNEVRNLLDKFGNINFLYIINSQTNENHNNTSIAFVNVINFKSIIPLFMNLRNYKIEKFGKTYNLKISYSSVQGKPKLKEFIQKYKFSKY
jgi:RNA recognition motif-containing protein